MIKKLISNTCERMNIVRNPINRNDRYGILYKAWGIVFTNLVQGGYYEFGLYQGNTFVDSWRIYQQYRQWVNSQLHSPEQWRQLAIKEFAHYAHDFFGFDSFQGIPENKEGNRSFQGGMFACSKDRVEAKCIQAKMKYQLIEGFFSQIDAKRMQDLPVAAIVNIDCDLYISAKDALTLIKPKLQQGTIVLMDDYNCFNADNQQGERKALVEFCRENPQFSFEPWWPYQHVGQSFITHLKKA